MDRSDVGAEKLVDLPWSGRNGGTAEWFVRFPVFELAGAGGGGVSSAGKWEEEEKKTHHSLEQ